ncbi:MAG: class I SAM-dependent methyltransferase [Candidatus Thorarchaeota archaeon]
MGQYYSESLSAERLEKCYKIGSPRLQQYLQRESEYVSEHIKPQYHILELGSGYSRALSQFRKYTERVVGIDLSLENLRYSTKLYGQTLDLNQCNAITLPFQNMSFDIVICIQNGISAFKENPTDIVKESLRVTKKLGVCLFSTYSENFWDERLEWFIQQSKEGLLGEIDFRKTGDGVIVCKDGFRAITFTERDFEEIATQLKLKIDIEEIDSSSLFCKFHKE